MRISVQYPLVELLSGIIFILPVPLPVGLAASGYLQVAWSLIWIAALMGLLLMSAIDMRLRLIPDEFHAWFGVLGLTAVWIMGSSGPFSFLGGYGPLLGLSPQPILGHLFGAVFGGLFFTALVLVTKGRGMGLGDAKLGVSLGFLFGWPDMPLIVMLSFLLGAAYGICAMLWGRSRMKSTVPFGPFLALGSVAVILWGESILRGYFGLFGI